MPLHDKIRRGMWANMRVAPSLAHITKTSGGLLLSAIAIASPFGCSAAHEAEAGPQALSTDVRIPPNQALMATCDSKANNPYAGTCVETLFSCFAPKGECATSTKLDNDAFVQRTMWGDGSSVVRTLVSGGTNNIQVRDAKGEACAVYDVVEKNTDKERVTTFRGANGTDVLAVIHSDQDGSTVTCPDGSQVVLGGSAMAQRGCFAPTYYADRCDTLY
jgi:hypothetical protein